MTYRDPDDTIRAWFHDGPDRGAARGLEETLARLATARQGSRRDVRLPVWMPLAAALAVLLAVAVAFAAGFRIVLPPPPTSSPTPLATPAAGGDCRLVLPVHGREAVLFGTGFAPDTDVVIVMDRADGSQFTLDTTFSPQLHTDRTGGFFLPLRPFPEDLGTGRLTATAGCTTTFDYVVLAADLPAPCPDPAVAAPPLVDGPAYRAAVAADAPLAWWSLDDASSVAADARQDHDGTYLGNTEHAALTPLSDGGSAYFHHQFPNPTYIGFEPIVLEADFSIETWIYFCHWADGDAIVGSADQKASLLLGEGELSLNDGIDGVLWAGEPFPQGSWQHVVVVRAGDDLRMYRNGELDGEAVDSGWTAAFAVDQIGKGINDNYLGYLDEVALYDHALTPEQIAAHARPGS